MSISHTLEASETLWRRAILPASASIQEAIRNLDQVAIKIVLIVDPAGVLEGTISDGDIRRGLLRGLDLTSPITSLIHRNALVVPPGMEREDILQLMVANRVQQIPVVDELRRVVGLHLWDELQGMPQRGNLMIIMAGGKGTRLRPHTDNCPKPMLPVGGKPMLEHIIERAKGEGFKHFVLAVHYLGHMIEDHFGDGARLDVRIDYLREQTPLGTAGALSLLDPRSDLPFIVTNGDVMTDIRYGELLDFHSRYEAAATMAVRIYEWQHPFGVVQMNGVEIVGFVEKPITRRHINAGVYAISPVALDCLVQGEHCDMPSLFDKLKILRKRIVAYPMHEPWLDVGRPDDLARATDSFGNIERQSQ
ncbi:nucleotidyltransferase family protein [uncultured Lamprocystis sp.]|jgi:dTDP-glucose pyrophosphorylase|uniref:nucleotidyltransferase family protein n=1 Tax=uncultured Lamprocystis sp. TaxID=543132 RepID=UPI0025CC619E|nr:nucleotidyltransferase family protein [uncultured Lamprocystis sp.]